ncbi:MAG: ABC transporter substrate-binding protein [Tepidisphaeraceae bacterium]
MRGITWDHSRAFPPLVATAQRFEELNPGIRVVWEKRSLHAFGHADVAELASRFDLVVMDHPWCGFSIDRRVFVNLAALIEQNVLDSFREASVGPSYESYVYAGQLVALPIDAATPVACFRPDLLPAADVPKKWDDLMNLARGGRVAVSMFHVDLLLHLVMLAATADPKVFTSPEEWASDETARAAMDRLAELVRLVPASCDGLNPIAVYERMTRSDELVYCPFAYGYSNYARPEFTNKSLRFADLISDSAGRPLRSVLGGTGVALSAGCRNVDAALAYMQFTASAGVQAGLYTLAGGQPAHRAAWTDKRADSAAGGFFADTLPSTDRAYVRPRYHGFLHFQENAGRPLLEWARGGGDAGHVLDAMNDIYRASRRIGGAGASQEN